MRTKTSLLSAAVISAGICAASAQVYSVNVVGYVNAALVGGTPAKYTLVNNPLDNKVSNAISNLFSGLPAGSQVLKWSGSGFAIYNRVAFGTGWTPANAETNRISPGEGVFLRTPVGSPGLTNTFVGEVVQGALANVFPVGYSLEGNEAPIAGTATDLGLTATIPVTTPASQLLKYNTASQSYQIFNRVSFGAGWTPSVPSITVNEGFFVRNLSNAPVTWTRNFTVQ